MDKIISILNEIGLPYAYHHFAEGDGCPVDTSQPQAEKSRPSRQARQSPNPPFICYLLPNSDNFAADGRVYYKINDVHIELYTDFKNTELELKVEEVLDRYNIFYNKSEVWIHSEKLYEVMYSYEIGGTDNAE